jgi:hypothetical protein
MFLFDQSAAKLHDEINVVCFSFLLLFTVYVFATHCPFDDLLRARMLVLNDYGVSSYVANESIFFWVRDVTVPHDWEVPSDYVYLSFVALAYLLFDIIYLVLIPECTTRLTSVLVHHVISAATIVAAIHIHAEAGIALCLVVEYNTFLLVLKNLQQFSENDNASVFSKVVSGAAQTVYKYTQPGIHAMYMLSWFILRLVYYPFLVLAFHRYLNLPVFGYYYHIIVGSTTALTALNYYWTFSIPNQNLKFLTAFIAVGVFAGLTFL